MHYININTSQMKAFLFAFVLFFCAHAHIYSSDNRVVYDYSGNPLYYRIFLALETGLGSSDYLKINWPLRIHSSTDKSVVKVNLISFSNNLQVASTYCENFPVGSTDTLYYVTFGVSLTAQKWYQIQIYPNLVPSVTLPFYGLIQIQAISSLLTNFITYDSNYAFGYISIQSALSTPGGLGVAVSTSSVSANIPASIYTVNIDLTPQNSSSTGGNFTLYIYFDNTNAAHTGSGTTLLDFSFMGLCQSVTPATGSAAVLNGCQISSDLYTITFSVNQIIANQPIRIQTQISNPLYKSTRGIRAYYVDFISGVVKENGYAASAMTVNTIPINDLVSSRVYLFWGISTDEFTSDPELAPLSLGLYKSAVGSNVGPFNSFNCGFSFNSTSPISGRYTVKMYLGATGFLEGSIAHNLPAYSNLNVYCSYDTAGFQIVCENVGPFINTYYRYFISGKAYYSSGVTSPVYKFGDVTILPVVFDSAGNQLSSVTLYDPLVSNDSINLRSSQQFLDTSGFHNQNSYKIGTAKIVSFEDDGTLSSTANAMKKFMTGTNTTIGIVPDLGVSQQLLLLMKVGSVSGGSGSGNAYKMRLLYNSQVIGFETGGESRGLDFVGYDSANSVWSISKSPCFVTGYVVCQKYNNDTPTYNIQIQKTATNGYNFYGLYKFDCGLAYTNTPSCWTGNCATACNLFTGYGTSDTNAGVMSLRKVTFPSTQFHSNVYADQNLLDFLVVFLQGSGFVSASLINAYTMVGTKIQNIKASYVNYYDYDATNYNRGQRVPTMIRISGGILPKESRNATAIGVFFDDSVDAQTFYTYKNKARDVGCSTGSCYYYPNTNVIMFPNDVWPTMRRVDVYNIPPIQNQFNILIPVTPLATRYSYSGTPLPDTLTIAFFTKNYSIGDATGLLQTVAVYRLFGTVVTGSIIGPIGAINGLSGRGSNYFTTSSSYFSSSGVTSYSGHSISYYINTTNINSNPPNNTFIYGYSGTFTFNNQYGCGVTISSLYYNIFSSSTVAFQNPPANTAKTCTLFGYVYNQQTLGQNPSRNGQWIYIAYCPIDSTINLNGPDGNIHFYNPQYPSVFTYNYVLSSVMTYGISDPTGQLVHYKLQPGTIPSSFVRTCTTSKPDVYNPSAIGSSGKQRSTFIISTPQIRMAAANTYNGYTSFYVVITLPVISNLVMSTLTVQQCVISDPNLSCSVVGGSSAMVTVNYIGTGVITVTYFQIQLYAVTTGSLGSGGDYTVSIQLPQYESSSFTNFGSSLTGGTRITFCTCTSNFKIGNTPYGTSMVFQAPVTESVQKAAKSWYTFNFGSYDYRQAFFSTSYFQFSFGFLYDPSYAAKVTDSNFRCIVYENQQGNLVLSNKWATIDLASFATVQLRPKQLINDPNTYLFTMKCYGAGAPGGSNTTSMTLSWVDNSVNIQTATSLAYPSTTYTTAATTSLTATLDSKKFNTQGMKAFYTFTITTSLLTATSRIYINFPFTLSSRLDNEGYVQCYLRSGVGGTPIFTYCQFSQERQISIWNNLNIVSTTTIYIDIFNIQVPKSTDTTPSVIVISLDMDSDYSNGVTSKATLANTASAATAVSDIIITSTSVNTNFIRTPQTITIKFDTLTTTVVAAGAYLYLLLPGPYGEWINRGQVLSTSTQCYLSADNLATTNRLSACDFISKRVLKMTISTSSSYRYHTLTLTGLYSPSKVPTERYNQYRFALFTSSTAAATDVNRYSFTDLSKQLTLIPNSNLIDLSWKYYSIAVSDSLVTLTDISTSTFIVYIGYYSNVIELRQSLYPSNFILEMSLTLNNYNLVDYLHKDGTNIRLGYQNTYYRIATSSNVVAGLYTLQYSKTGDTNNKYTQAPPLTLVVSNALCKLTTKQNSYSLPRGGMTVPIVINCMSCIPITNITITPVFSSGEVSINPSLSSIVLKPSLKDGQLYIVAKHTLGSLAVGAIVTVTFTITGPQAAYYDTIPSVSLSIVDSAPFQTLPTATALSTPSRSYNKATFTLQCSMASRIYWGLGIYPSILNSQALDFEARIISGATGLLTNFTESEDFYMKVYGVNYVTTTQTLPKTLYNLKSNSQYIFKYYCVNQMGLISDGQSFIFNSLNYGAYLMKVSIIFRGSITYQQYNDLSCSLALTFQVPYSRIMTEAMSVCGGSISPFYLTSTDVIIKEANSNGEYMYNFYILPDYTIPIDTTNANVRSSLTLSSTSTTVITSTSNFQSLPTLIQMNTEDIQFFATPNLKMNSPVSGLNSLVVTASITNMNGFIVIGCMNGLFDSSIMTFPTPSYIKKGLISQNVTLLQVKMIYSIQNYNMTFTFPSLNSDSSYTCFYFATPQDPQISAASTTVGSFNAKTLQALVVDINFGVSIKTLGLWIGLILIIFGIQ